MEVCIFGSFYLFICIALKHGHKAALQKLGLDLDSTFLKSKSEVTDLREKSLRWHKE